MKVFLRVGVPTLAVAFLFGAALPTEARADYLYDATGGAAGGGDSISSAGPILADRFVSTINGTLGAVTLNLMLSSATTGSGATVDLFTDNGSAGPGAATLIANIDESALSASNFSSLSFQPTTTIALLNGSSYYVGVVDASGNSNLTLGYTVDPAVLARPTVANGADYYNNAGVQPNAGGPYEIQVAGVPAVPESGSLILMFFGLFTLAAARPFRKILIGPVQ